MALKEQGANFVGANTNECKSCYCNRYMRNERGRGGGNKQDCSIHHLSRVSHLRLKRERPLWWSGNNKDIFFWIKYVCGFLMTKINVFCTNRLPQLKAGSSNQTSLQSFEAETSKGIIAHTWNIQNIFSEGVQYHLSNFDNIIAQAQIINVCKYNIIPEGPDDYGRIPIQIMAKLVRIDFVHDRLVLFPIIKKNITRTRREKMIWEFYEFWALTPLKGFTDLDRLHQPWVSENSQKFWWPRDDRWKKSFFVRIWKLFFSVCNSNHLRVLAKRATTQRSEEELLLDDAANSFKSWIGAHGISFTLFKKFLQTNAVSLKVLWQGIANIFGQRDWKRATLFPRAIQGLLSSGQSTSSLKGGGGEQFNGRTL